MQLSVSCNLKIAREKYDINTMHNNNKSSEINLNS